MSKNWDIGDRVVFRTARGMPLQEGTITDISDGVYLKYTVEMDNGEEVVLRDDDILDLWRWNN